MWPRSARGKEWKKAAGELGLHKSLGLSMWGRTEGVWVAATLVGPEEGPHRIAVKVWRRRRMPLPTLQDYLDVGGYGVHEDADLIVSFVRKTIALAKKASLDTQHPVRVGCVILVLANAILFFGLIAGALFVTTISGLLRWVF